MVNLLLIFWQPLLGTNVFPTDEKPRYIEGMAISAAFTFFTGVLAFGLRSLLVWENRKLDQKYGSNKNRVVSQPGAEGVESEVGEEIMAQLSDMSCDDKPSPA